MFVTMNNENLLPLKERLDALGVKKGFDVESPQGVYSAIRANPDTFQGKKFTVKTFWDLKLEKFTKRVIRIK